MVFTWEDGSVIAESFPPTIAIDSGFHRDVLNGDMAPWMLPIVRESDGRHGILIDVMNGRCRYLHDFLDSSTGNVHYIAEELDGKVDE